jgi:UDP-N-acetylglucosamine 4,6-dehydratase
MGRLMKNLTGDLLITGGTGSLGKTLIKKILQETEIKRIIIFSRDELKQLEVRNLFANNKRLRFFLGDVRDLARLTLAMKEVEYVIHCAALKQVDTGEYNPFEFIKTNILGSQNVIEASMNSGVSKVIALSTDKASSPINLYGATKLTADKLFISANNYSQKLGTKYSVVRYGNVLNSRGSVIPIFKDCKISGKPITITDERMTRFWITMEQAANFVIESLFQMEGGELYVPKIPSARIIDIAKIISPKSKIEFTGIRPGEKLHEEMISEEDMIRTYVVDEKRLLVAPVIADWGYKIPSLRNLAGNAAYRSDTNDLWLNDQDIYELIK